MSLTPAPDGYPIKLVRDRMPEIINGTGEHGDLFYRSIPPEERPSWLRKKLGEEVLEYLVDGGRGELAQVLAVVVELAHVHGTTIGGLIRDVADDPRGGFANGMMMYGYHREFDAR